MNTDFKIEVASCKHAMFAEDICHQMQESAQERGIGIAKRSPGYIVHKMEEGKAIIARHRNGQWAGFCYFEVWDNEQFISNSGLIVVPEFRHAGLAERIKRKLFRVCRKLFPKAKLFGITTGHAVMKINSQFGFKPVPFSEITQDERFWAGCQSCCNHDILERTHRKLCLCTAMLYDPEAHQRNQPTAVPA